MVEFISNNLILSWVISVGLATIFLNILSTIIHRRIDSFIPKIFARWRESNERRSEKERELLLNLVSDESFYFDYRISKIEMNNKAWFLMLFVLIFSSFTVLAHFARTQNWGGTTESMVWIEPLALAFTAVFAIDGFKASFSSYLSQFFINTSQQIKETGTAKFFSIEDAKQFQADLIAKIQLKSDGDKHTETKP